MKSITINKLFNVLFIIVSAMFIGIVGLGYLIFNNQNALVQSHELRYDSYLLADELRQSSDDLTRLARTYVVTGENKYEDFYMDILDIRNGNKARPEHYERIYWDLVISDGTPPRPDSELMISLNDLMKEAGFTDAEFEKLTQANANSDGLVNTEVIAMNAIKNNLSDEAQSMMKVNESPTEFARRIMFDTNYHQFKGSIVSPINEFFGMLNDRTLANVEYYTLLQEKLLIAVGVILLIALLSIITIFIILYRKLQRPLHEMPETITQVAEGDFTTTLNVRSNDELGIISNQFNKMVSDVRGVLEAMKNTIQAAQSTSSEITEATSSASESNSQVSKAIMEIAEGASNLSEKAFASLESSNHLSSGLQTISNEITGMFDKTQLMKEKNNEGVQSMLELESQLAENSSAAQKVAKGIQELSVKSDLIVGILDAIDSIAEQTNLLALNAAIEAARAGDAGKGFAVVADEVRKLAEESSKATNEIQSIIQNITSIIKSTEDDMESAKNIVINVDSKMKDTRKVYEEIILATNETIEGIDTINTNLQGLEKTKEQSKVAIEDMSALSEESAASAEEITASVEEQANAMDQINDSMQTLNELVENLGSLSERFKI